LLISSLSLSSQDINFAFNSSQQYTMSTNHDYYIGLHVKSGNVNGVNYINVAANNSESAFYGNIAKWNSVSWANTTASDLYFKIYGILAEKLTASNEGHTGNENGVTASFSSYWVRSGSINCSGYIFSLNYGSGYTNNTWAAFSDTNNVWANISQVLLGSASQVGNTVYYKTFANASNGKWYVSAENSFVLQATVTFAFSNVGKVEKNDVLLSNSSVTYTTPTTLKLDALPGSTYSFLNWNWTNSAATSTDNSLSFIVTNQTSLTCWFGPGYTAGYWLGYSAGWADGNLSGYTAGHSAGYNEGWASGNSTGYAAGYAAGFADGFASFVFLGNATEGQVLAGYTFYNNASALRTGNYTAPTPGPGGAGDISTNDAFLYLMLTGVCSLLFFTALKASKNKKGNKS
jgi:hypothetical protein